MSGPAVDHPSRSALRTISVTWNLVWHLAVSTGIIAVGVLTIRPPGWSGRGLWVVLLLIVNSLFLYSRHLSDEAVTNRVRVVLLGLGGVAAAALLAAGERGTTYLFAFLLAAHAGYRLDTVRAASIAGVTGLLCTGILIYQLGPEDHSGWLVGAVTVACVLIGMVRRSHEGMLKAAITAAEAAERAAVAEAGNAALAERSRIARDVHDVLAHSLAGVNMQLELTDALLDTGDSDRVRESVGRAQRLVLQSLKQAQWTVKVLREDALPLVDTVTAMLDSSGFPDSLTVVGMVRETNAQQTQNLVRIVQEALTNAARHAPGAAVRVTLRYDPEKVTLEVCNGRPARSPDKEIGSGLGLVGMRERVALLGGTISAGPVVEAPDNGGWRVEAVIPA